MNAFVDIKFKVDYQWLGVIDQDKIDFLESVKDFIWIAPFFDFNFNINKIGDAGCCRLIKLSEKDTLEFKITHEKDSGASYRYLLTGIQAGHLKALGRKAKRGGWTGEESIQINSIQAIFCRLVPSMPGALKDMADFMS